MRSSPSETPFFVVHNTAQGRRGNKEGEQTGDWCFPNDAQETTCSRIACGTCWKWRFLTTTPDLLSPNLWVSGPDSALSKFPQQIWCPLKPKNPWKGAGSYLKLWGFPRLLLEWFQVNNKPHSIGREKFNQSEPSPGFHFAFYCEDTICIIHQWHNICYSNS